MATMTKTATRVTAPKPFNLPSRRAEGGSGPELNSAALRDGAQEVGGGRGRLR